MPGEHISPRNQIGSDFLIPLCGKALASLENPALKRRQTAQSGRKLPGIFGRRTAMALCMSPFVQPGAWPAGSHLPEMAHPM
jgi:hypothetical protein